MVSSVCRGPTRTPNGYLASALAICNRECVLLQLEKGCVVACLLKFEEAGLKSQPAGDAALQADDLAHGCNVKLSSAR